MSEELSEDGDLMLRLIYDLSEEKGMNMNNIDNIEKCNHEREVQIDSIKCNCLKCLDCTLVSLCQPCLTMAFTRSKQLEK